MPIETPKQLLAQVRRLQSAQPRTARYASKLKTAGIWSDESAWYSSQKEHWEGWLRHYNGPGAYGRKVSNRSAEFVYNHIVCPPMLMWLAEASGVTSARLAAAQKAALAAGDRLQSHCSAIREVIPWEAAKSALLATAGARMTQSRTPANT